jgi:glycerol-3-phosphate dehydrogenase
MKTRADILKPVAESEVLIIGAGVIGVSIAHELTKRGIKPLVIDREADVGMGISKSSGGFVNAGLMPVIDALVKEMTGGDPLAEIDSDRLRSMQEGYAAFDPQLHDLAVAHRHLDSLILARNEQELATLRRLMQLAEHFPSVALQWLEKDALFRREPNITPSAVAGVYDPAGTILVFSHDYVVAVAENARANGAEFWMETRCRAIDHYDGVYRVTTNRGTFRARFVINCAGKYADRIADMAGAGRDWTLSYFRTQAFILDRRLNGLIDSFITFPPAGMMVQALSPLLGGNLLLYGSSIEPVSDPEAVETLEADYQSAIETMQQLAPALRAADIITAYTGVRVYCSANPDDHTITAAPNQPCFINVIPRMPGFTPAISIAGRVAAMLEEQGLTLGTHRDFDSKRIAIPRFRELDEATRNALIAVDSRYGKVICRCETVTEGEVVEAIRRGADTVQGVMFRTRAGMGRCQRNFCGSQLMAVLSRRKKIALNQVTFKGSGSEFLARRPTKNPTPVSPKLLEDDTKKKP